MAIPYTEATRAEAYSRGVRFLAVNGADNSIDSEHPSKYAACVAADAIGGTSYVIESFGVDGFSGHSASIVTTLADARTFLRKDGSATLTN
ncbi:hypothetical protein [Caballeronia sp. ATUFL_M1_KS5A]|uniref:hypothetical protein n=1 Tax=Caballeronia sp. ATUFL_M1_KS5A TaxID=2921778 RepID=UPI002027BF50|nr:hypothetical protein [Caballeronia sp. ATUFL_M1_KS5A]